jgi:hypothetical protein
MVLEEQADKVSILWNSISAEKISDKFIILL